MLFETYGEPEVSQEYLRPQCGRCGLAKTCKTPKMPIHGLGRKGILVVGEFPSPKDDEEGKPFMDKGGMHLRTVLRQVGIELDFDCWSMNSIICRKQGEDPEPNQNQIDWCRPNITKAIKDLKPKVIIPIGDAAVRSVIAPMWKDTFDSIDRWVGWNIPARKYNAWICPVWSQHYVSYMVEPLNSRPSREAPVISLWWKRYLKNAVEHTDYPWAVVEDPKDKVRVELDVDAASAWIRSKIQAGGGVAFDYETNRLKPDVAGCEIVCCSICWRGKETIAYPMAGSAINATREMLLSDLPKIGWNKKFEERWSRAILGVEVNNWVHDGMLSAHHLDSRKKITSAKFQGLVRLGVGSWNTKVEPFLKDYAGSRGFNRIREANMHDLLVYCGIDSYVEYHAGVLQKKEMFGE